MAVKQINTSHILPSGWAGPFIDAGSVYVLCLDGSNQPEVWKSGTDPLVDSWTQQDSANEPSLGTGNTYGAAYQLSDQIHMAFYDDTGPNAEYSVFRSASHGSANTWGTVNETIQGGITNAGWNFCLFAMRADGDRICLYNGTRERIMGNNFARVVYARWEGSSWVTDIAVSASGLEYSAEPYAIGRGASDKMHMVFWQSASNWYGYRALDNANTLSSYQIGGSDLTPGSTARSPVCTYFDSSGNEVIGHVLQLGTLGVYNQTWTNSGTVSTPIVASGHASPAYPMSAVYGKKVYAIWKDNTAGDIYYAISDDGAAFGSKTLLYDASGATTRISANVFTRGSNDVLAFVVTDGGDLYYDELVISAPAEIYPRNPILFQRAVERAAYW